MQGVDGVEFRVLGPIEVWVGGHPVDLGPRMHRALLALLVMEANRVVSVDRLVDQLWGDEPPPSAAVTLQGYVAGLRRALEPDRPARTPPRVLLTQAPGYLLRVAPEAIDAARFEALAAQGRELLAADRPAAAREVLSRALALWRGAPYSDLAFEAFVGPEAARLSELWATAAETSAEAELAAGNHVGAVGELERLVAAEPLRERRWELYALGLYRCGRQADALRALDRARRTLAEELGIEPRPSLRQLEQDILLQSPSLEWHPTPDSVPFAGTGQVSELRKSDTASTAFKSDPSRSPLVGRDCELGELLAALDEVRRGQSRVVLVAGEPGIGKTRLAESLSTRAVDRGVWVAWGRCHEGEAAPAFWPWIQVVRALSEGAGPDTIRAALGVSVADLAQIVPELGRPAEDAAPRVFDAEVARTRLYDAVVGLVLRLAGAHPLVVVLDDLHAADVASLQLLQLLGAQLQTAPVLLLCTYREPEAEAAGAVQAALVALARHPGLTRLRLRGLAPAAVTEVVAAVSGEEAAAGVAEAIHARTDGNPFFVTELVRLLHGERRLREEGSVGGAGVPVGVRDVIRRRLGRLPTEALELLAAASVVGREFDLDVVLTATGEGDDRALESVERALLIGVVQESVTPGRYRFPHALVHETVYEGLSAPRRARLHRRVGEAIERLAAGDEVAHVAELAHHFFRAVPAGAAAERAFDYALQAAESAVSKLGYEQAEEHLRRALTLLERLPVASRAARELAAQTRLGSLLVQTRGYDDAEVQQVWSRAAELSQEVGATGELLGALWGLWSLSLVRGQCSAADHLAGEVLAHGRQSGDPAFLAAGHETVGMTLLHKGAPVRAAEHLKEAVSRWRSLSDEAVSDVLLEKHPAVACTGLLALARWLLGEDEAAAGLACDALRSARDVSHPFTLATVLFLDAWLAIFQGDEVRALARAEEATVVCREGNFPAYRVICSVFSAWAQAAAGVPQTGAAEATGAMNAVRGAGVRMLRPFLLGLLSDARRRAGDVDGALEAVDEGLAEAEGTEERFWEAELHRLRGELLGTEGVLDKAEECLVRALAIARGQQAAALEQRAVESLRQLAQASRPLPG